MGRPDRRGAGRGAEPRGRERGAPAGGVRRPEEYAARVADALGAAPSRGWRAAVRGLTWQDLGTAAAIGLSSFLLADGLWALGAGETAVLGPAAWAVCAVAALVLAAGTARVVVAARHDPDADPVVDPRDGADMVPVGVAVGGLLSR